MPILLAALLGVFWVTLARHSWWARLLGYGSAVAFAIVAVVAVLELGWITAAMWALLSVALRFVVERRIDRRGRIDD